MVGKTASRTVVAVAATLLLSCAASRKERGSLEVVNGSESSVSRVHLSTGKLQINAGRLRPGQAVGPVDYVFEEELLVRWADPMGGRHSHRFEPALLTAGSECRITITATEANLGCKKGSVR